MARPLHELPFFLLLFGVASASMYVPAAYALALNQHFHARSFFYAGTLGLVVALLIGISLYGRKRRKRRSMLEYLLSLFAAFTVLPLFLALPFYEALETTSFLNAYFEMVSCLTTTGATMFEDHSRLGGALHLWRAQVGWMGGFLMWVAAAAILAPLNLGGFEVTTSAEPGQTGGQSDLYDPEDANRRLIRVTRQLFPVYGGLTMALALLLTILGDRPLVAVSHAMSTLATSGISPINGVQTSGAGVAGEMVIFLFLLFALSRMTFSADNITTARRSILRDPEFRIAMVLVIGLPLLLFLRHWVAAFDVAAAESIGVGLRALWGGFFTVLSFLTTTGFQSADWADTRNWSGLGTPGLLLMALALVGGGVATTAGGVKLLRVYALYLHGLREMHHLVHPSSVSGADPHSRIQRKGAYLAWIFFMLFALSLTAVTLVFAALGATFEQAMVLGIAGLSTTGPLITAASDQPIDLVSFDAAAKLVLCATMVLGRLETLAIIALFNPELWRR